MPRPLKEQAIRLCKAADELQQTLGRSATAAELAGRLEVDQEEVLEALKAVTSQRQLSLDQPVGDGTGGCLGSQIAAPGPREEPEDLLALMGLVAALPAQERTVVVLRFFGELDQDAIAAELGCSQMQVSRLLRRALARLRAQLVEP